MLLRAITFVRGRVPLGYLFLSHCEIQNKEKLQTFLLNKAKRKYWKYPGTMSPFLNQLTNVKGGIISYPPMIINKDLTLIQNRLTANGAMFISVFSSSANCEINLPVTGPSDMPSMA